MASDRWEQISRIYDAALDVAEEERPAFLERNCQGDQELRREVESLLAYDKQAQGFIDRPAMAMTAEKLAGEPPSLIGRQLGHYQIVSVLGAGGMGEVYKAKDARLNRTVAIKVLPRVLSERADLRQRFTREARAIASLSHPNICPLYDIGRQDGVDFLVMEYLEGETLSKRLRNGPLPTEQLLRTAVEIATALDQAHRHGVIHRDLKPGNIMLTKQGAKLLDFGLAKQKHPPLTQASSSLSPLPRGTTGGQTATGSESLTEQGMILGTLEYMAPEQVEGKEADTRTDIFAIGVVIYEMATGRKAFEGESKASLTAAILTSEPPSITKVQPMAPPALERVVKRCLAKDPEERWQTARDLASELKWIAEARTTAGVEAAGLKPRVIGRRRELLYGALAIAVFVAAIVGVFSYVRPVRAPGQPIFAEILPPERTQFAFSRIPALSPDGRTLAFSAADESGKTMVWVRSLDAQSAQPLAGTERAEGFLFWSADGRKLGFFADRKLKTVEVSGGPALPLADAPANAGGSWNREGTLLCVPDISKGLVQVTASGGTPIPVLKVDRSKVSYYAWPKFLPDGKHFLYQATLFDPAYSGIYFASLDGKENRLLLRTNSNATYASGYLLYLRDTTLMAQALDAERGQLKGEAHPVAQSVASGGYGYSHFDVSESGMLIYRWVTQQTRRITRFDRAGKELSVIKEVDGFSEDPRFSPDGAKLSFGSWGGTNPGIRVEELDRGVSMRLTATANVTPVWSPDGRRILYCSFLGKVRPGIYQRNSDGTGGEELFLPAEPSDPSVWPTSWSRDGRFILVVSGSGWNPIQNLWVLPLAGDGKRRLFVQNAFDGQFSPDGRWVAYTSIESGELQVYVVPFDANAVLNTKPGDVAIPAGKWLISSSGGAIARWRGDGKEIFYRDPGPGKHMWAAEVDGSGSSFKARKAQPLFRVAEWTNTQFDVTPDGKQFVIITQKTIDPNTPLTLVVNWTALLGTKP
jgi:eukaryotic-like serine/threonine-protein kinase